MTSTNNIKEKSKATADEILYAVTEIAKIQRAEKANYYSRYIIQFNTITENVALSVIEGVLSNIYRNGFKIPETSNNLYNIFLESFNGKIEELHTSYSEMIAKSFIGKSREKSNTTGLCSLEDPSRQYPMIFVEPFPESKNPTKWEREVFIYNKQFNLENIEQAVINFYKKKVNDFEIRVMKNLSKLLSQPNTPSDQDQLAVICADICLINMLFIQDKCMAKTVADINQDILKSDSTMVIHFDINSPIMDPDFYAQFHTVAFNSAKKIINLG